ncbi:STE/STE7/MEK1 protein kinase [Pseudogymnoascus sp. WSF 3629]|nr:STE/STE7/MEK1 protein kinase [Pseudogymnoascus sp. WSF 3629]
MSGEGFGVRTMKRKNVKGLALNAPPPRAPAPSNDDHAALDDAASGRTAQLEIGIEYKLDLKREDLEVLKELGSGNGGTVSKVRHIATGTVMARKVIHVEAKKEIRRRIVRELHIMHECNSDYIVNFYGAFLSESNDVIMCMEYMDVGALDRVSRDFGPIRVDVLGKIAEATLGGLTYLYIKHHIMHRDIKPSNILVNSRGFIKLCDFGVSGELVNSVADTFVGTSTYMAPERIQGEKYTVKSDVWSFGLSIMELAIGKFPFDASEHLSDGDSAPAGILDLLQQIVHEPAPRLPKSEAFPQILEDMIQKCMSKRPEERPTPQELYEREPFVQAAKRTPVDLRDWAVSLMEKHNRRSHLAPQLSPATQELLRSTDTPPSATLPPSTTTSSFALPTSSSTSGDIPITTDPRDPRMAAISPREMVVNTINGIRSPTKVATPSIQTPGTRTPGLQQGQQQGLGIQGEQRGGQGGFGQRKGMSPEVEQGGFSHVLPIRNAPPGGPLPAPPVPRKEGGGRFFGVNGGGGGY